MDRFIERHEFGSELARSPCPEPSPPALGDGAEIPFGSITADEGLGMGFAINATQDYELTQLLAANALATARMSAYRIPCWGSIIRA